MHNMAPTFPKLKPTFAVASTIILCLMVAGLTIFADYDTQSTKPRGLSTSFTRLWSVKNTRKDYHHLAPAGVRKYAGNASIDTKPTGNQSEIENVATSGRNSTDEGKPADEKKPTDEGEPTDEKKPTDEKEPTDEKKPTDEGEPMDEKNPGEGKAEVVIKLAEGQDKKKEDSELPPCREVPQFPPNEAKITPRKEAISLEKVRTEIFGDAVQRVGDLCARANTTMPSLNEKRKAMMTTAKLIDESLAEMDLGADVGDYHWLPGGHWKPKSCRPKWKVAIVVPFRDRFDNLPIFLRHIVPLLKRQELEFSIFISEQRNKLIFNRAMLMNVGFVEALNFTNYDCVVFHDVDHIALSANNYFGCNDFPRHFISGEVAWKYKLLYADLFGGVTGLTVAQLRLINGLPNAYWGWGGEDDDFAKRVVYKGLGRTRPAGAAGYFDTIEHHMAHTKLNDGRFCLLRSAAERVNTDGLSNLRYDPPVIELHQLYTSVSTNIQKLPWNKHWGRCNGMR